MQRERILFVDDEPQILRGLARMLRPMRDEWDTDFANSAAEALEKLSEDHFDIVVSDMRMPGMNGAALFEKVAEEYPSTVRIILSGQAGEDELMQAVNAAHQYLAKPCDPDRLKASIGRATALHDFLQEGALVDSVSTMTTIPSFPAAYGEVMSIVNGEDPSLEAVGEVVAHDPGMTAKVLQLVNSSFFGFARTIGDVKHATSLLGIERILSLILGVHVFRELESAKRAGIDMTHLWERSSRMAHHAQEIAKFEGADKETAGMAQVAGLLSVAGTLVLAAEFPDRYAAALAKGGQHVATEEAEREEFGASSTQVGAYLLGLWGLPPSIVEAVAFYRNPSALPLTDGFKPVAAVHAAAALDPSHEPALEADIGFLEEAGMAERLDTWSALVEEEEEAA